MSYCSKFRKCQENETQHGPGQPWMRVEENAVSQFRFSYIGWRTVATTLSLLLFLRNREKKNTNNDSLHWISVPRYVLSILTSEIFATNGFLRTSSSALYCSHLLQRLMNWISVWAFLQTFSETFVNLKLRFKMSGRKYLYSMLWQSFVTRVSFKR